MKYITRFLFIFILFSCSDSGETSKNCEVVINADGPGFLKVINNRDTRVYVFLPEYAFGAIINGSTCEIYGLAKGNRKAEISICANSDCDTYSDTKNVTFLIENEKTYIIEVNGDFFN